jgi:preprotein translocase subunit YajC
MKTNKSSLASGVIVLIMFLAAGIVFLYLTWRPIQWHESAIEYFKTQIETETPDLITLGIACVFMFFVLAGTKKVVKRNNDYMKRKEAGRDY